MEQLGWRARASPIKPTLNILPECTGVVLLVVKLVLLPGFLFTSHFRSGSISQMFICTPVIWVSGMGCCGLGTVSLFQQGRDWSESQAAYFDLTWIVLIGAIVSKISVSFLVRRLAACVGSSHRYNSNQDTSLTNKVF